jgi:type IV pilus assembly protein PilA
MKRVQLGFTDCRSEIRIVYAIVFMLVAVAYPAYQDYTARSKVSEVELATTACQTAIAGAFISADRLPVANGFGCEKTVTKNKYVEKVETNAAGKITVTFATGIDSSIDGKFLVWIPLQERDWCHDNSR